MWVLITALSPVLAQTVDVGPLEAVPLADATATCLEGKPRGALDQNRTDRTLAFAQVVRGLLSVGVEERATLVGTPDGAAWPAMPADADYTPKVAITVPWVADACLAVGRHWVEVGAALQSTCAVDKKGCRAAFTEAELDIVKAAQKAAKKESGPPDPFWSTLKGFDDGLTTWHDPEPFLMRGCSLPDRAATDSRFIDTDDLKASRRACLQLVALAGRGLPEAVEALDCDSPWRQTAEDADQIVLPGTDLGIGSASKALEHLSRMDIAPVTCGGAMWREALPELWRSGQGTRACVDPDLPMTDRRSLCPDLTSKLDGGCAANDAPSCYALGRMTLVGLDVPMNERAGIEMLARACEARHKPACEDVVSFEPVVTGWVAPLVAPSEGKPTEEGLREALALLVQFQVSLGDAWTRDRAVALFEAAKTLKLPDLQWEILDQFDPQLDEAWRDEVKKKLPKRD